MSALDALRLRASAALHQKGFLRRDRTGTALFVTDYCKRTTNLSEAISALTAAQFTVSERNSLWFLDLTKDGWTELIRSIPPCQVPPLTDENLPFYSLAARLTRHPVAAEVQPILPIRLTLLCLDAGDENRLLRELPPILADCLKQKLPVPEAAGRLIAYYIGGNKRC